MSPSAFLLRSCALIPGWLCALPTWVFPPRYQALLGHHLEALQFTLVLTTLHPEAASGPAGQALSHKTAPQPPTGSSGCPLCF